MKYVCTVLARSPWPLTQYQKLDTGCTMAVMLTDPEEDYARGWVPFLGAQVCLDSRPLIPRTETEYWVEKAIRNMGDVGRPPYRVLDVFAGSGCIGLAVLMHIPNAHVTFAEKELRHFPSIKASLWKNDIDPRRTHFVQTDVWESVEGVFDYVFANPPYVSRERGTVSADTVMYEPPEALFADDDGFLLIEKTITGLPHHLAPEGTLWIEHEPFQRERIGTAARQYGFAASTEKDQYGVERYTRLTQNRMA